MSRRILGLLALVVLCGCDRNMEPYVPGEEPRQPDLSRIFPAGAEQAARGEGPPTIPPAPGEGRGGPDPTASARPITGSVVVAPELTARAEGPAILFIIARRGAGGPPLAVRRIPDPQFPLRFSLGPDDRMIRSMPFSGELRLTARLDRDGDAASRTPGDLQGSAPGVHSPGASDVEIVLDEAL